MLPTLSKEMCSISAFPGLEGSTTCTATACILCVHGKHLLLPHLLYAYALDNKYLPFPCCVERRVLHSRDLPML